MTRPPTRANSECYFTKSGRRWRTTDPEIPAALESELVHGLMAARLGVKAAKAIGETEALGRARARVNDAKIALGERGRAWWLPAEEEAVAHRLEATIRTPLRQRDEGSSICPSEAARVVGGREWRRWMDDAHATAWKMVEGGWLEVTQADRPVEPGTRCRLRLRRSSSRN